MIVEEDEEEENYSGKSRAKEVIIMMIAWIRSIVTILYAQQLKLLNKLCHPPPGLLLYRVKGMDLVHHHLSHSCRA